LARRLLQAGLAALPGQAWKVEQASLRDVAPKPTPDPAARPIIDASDRSEAGGRGPREPGSGRAEFLTAALNGLASLDDKMKYGFKLEIVTVR
jgi:hypothetical protein